MKTFGVLWNIYTTKEALPAGFQLLDSQMSSIEVGMMQQGGKCVPVPTFGIISMTSNSKSIFFSFFFSKTNTVLLDQL